MGVGADPGHVDSVNRRIAAGRRAGGGFQHIGSQPLGHGHADLGDQVFGGAGQGRVGTRGHPLRAEHRGLDLIRREHQRWQIIAIVENVADAGLSPDRHPLGHQVGDVAVDGAF